MNLPRILSIAALTLIAIPAALAQEKGTKPPPAAKPTVPAEASASSPGHTAVLSRQRPSYPMTTCVACGKALPATAVDYIKNGRLYRLDAEACQKAIDADPAAMAKKIDEAVIAQQKPTYPMKTSPISDKALEATAVDHVYGTRLVRLASKDEVAAFEKDPPAAMAKIDKALIDAQLAGYALKTCPVSNEALGGESGEPVNYLYGTKLVRFCCKKCITAFEKEPDKYSKALAAK
jgi:hypothetical protein